MMTNISAWDASNHASRTAVAYPPVIVRKHCLVQSALHCLTRQSILPSDYSEKVITVIDGVTPRIACSKFGIKSEFAVARIKVLSRIRLVCVTSAKHVDIRQNNIDDFYIINCRRW